MENYNQHSIEGQSLQLNAEAFTNLNCLKLYWSNLFESINLSSSSGRYANKTV